MAEQKIEVKSPKITIAPSIENELWNAPWNITLTADPEIRIGTASFVGEKEMGTVPLSVELSKEYREEYETEVLSMMVKWAFHFRNIYEVKTEADHEDDYGLKALKNSGFVFRTNEGRREFYSIVKPKTAWTGAYLFIGIFLGFIIGLVFSHLVVGMIIGVVIGVSIGLSMDMTANKERERVTGKSLTR